MKHFITLCPFQSQNFLQCHFDASKDNFNKPTLVSNSFREIMHRDHEKINILSDTITKLNMPCCAHLLSVVIDRFTSNYMIVLCRVYCTKLIFVAFIFFGKRNVSVH